MSDFAPTQLRLQWSGPHTLLSVSCIRPFTGEELRMFADVVESIEAMRDAVNAEKVNGRS